MGPEVWIALIGVVGTLIGTFGGVALTNRATAERGKRQWHRQNSDLRRQELFDACQDFGTQAVMLGSGNSDGMQVPYESFTKLQLRASNEIEVSARDLFGACNALQKSDLDDPNREQLLEDLVEKRTALLKKVREEVGRENPAYSLDKQ